jgi:hypothetical protein
MSGPVGLEDALRILKEQGCGPTPEKQMYTCPRCKTAALNITQNGAGPVFQCADGCVGIDATLEAIASLAVPKGAHVDTIEVLRGKLNLPELERIVKHGRGGSSYNLHLNDGRVITIGSIAILAAQAKFRTVFLPQVRRNPPRYKPSDWDDIVEQIEQAAEERDAVATQADETMSWIAGSLHTNKLRRNINLTSSSDMFELLGPGAAGKPPFFDQDGRLHLRLEHMLEWLGRFGGIRVTMPELSARLSELDFERTQHAARHGDVTRKARYWVSPAGIEDRL